MCWNLLRGVAGLSFRPPSDSDLRLQTQSQVEILPNGIPDYGVEDSNRFLWKPPAILCLTGIFEVLERAVWENRLRYYGISTFGRVCVETDNPLFQLITSMIGLSERAAHQVAGDKNAKHHFRLLMMLFNQAMTEGFTRFNTVTGQEDIASPVQTAYQLNDHGVRGRFLPGFVDRHLHERHPNEDNPQTTCRRSNSHSALR